MKDPWDWEEEDIEALIRDHVQESLILDYKQCASLAKDDVKKKHDLSKDVSAFANSAGGTLIYGVIEGQKNHFPIAIDDGYDPADISKEWIEQVINSTIQRRVDGIKIKAIELKKKNPGRVVYVVSIPQSKRAPHMAENHIFYKRHNFQSIAMEEYEVRDVAQRYEAPDLHIELFLKGHEQGLIFEACEQVSKPIMLNASIGNRSITPAMYYLATISIDKVVSIESRGELEDAGETTVLFGSEQVSMNQFCIKSAVPHKMPIWQGSSFRLASSPLSIALPKAENAQYLLVWTVSAPGMQQKAGAAFLKVANGRVSLEGSQGPESQS